MISKWTMIPARRPKAKLRLFCFPYAGSGASIFRDWPALLPEDIELVGIQLPGRENRFSEPRLTRLDEVIESLRDVVVDFSDRPFYFFGHSIGALIAFELTRALQREGLPRPSHLVVSGLAAPQLPRRNELLHRLDDDAFLARIRDFNGTPKALLEDAELMKLFVPLLRDDFTICETYVCRDRTPVECPLIALGGDADADVKLDELAAWSELAGGHYEYLTFHGDHFFIHPHRGKVLEILRLIGARVYRTSHDMKLEHSPQCC